MLGIGEMRALTALGTSELSMDEGHRRLLRSNVSATDRGQAGSSVLPRCDGRQRGGTRTRPCGRHAFFRLTDGKLSREFWESASRGTLLAGSARTKTGRPLNAVARVAMYVAQTGEQLTVNASRECVTGVPNFLKRWPIVTSQRRLPTWIARH